MAFFRNSILNGENPVKNENILPCHFSEIQLLFRYCLFEMIKRLGKISKIYRQLSLGKNFQLQFRKIDKSLLKGFSPPTVFSQFSFQGDYGAPLVLSKSLIGVVSRGNICSSTDMATFTQISSTDYTWQIRNVLNGITRRKKEANQGFGSGFQISLQPKSQFQ